MALVLGIQLSAAMIFILIWEMAIRYEWINSFYFGQPTQVGLYLIDKLQDGTLLDATWVTLSESLVGFVLGTSIGTACGLLLWWSRTLTDLFYPLIVALNAVPKLIFAPIFLLIFGLGFEFKVVNSFAGVVIVALLSAYVGTQQADADQADLIRSMGGNRWRVFQLIVVPTALPLIIVSMEINIGISLVGAVVGEFLASNEGLGYLAIYGAGTFDMSLVLVSVATLIVLAVVMYGAIRLIGHWLLPRRHETLQAPG